MCALVTGVQTCALPIYPRALGVSDGKNRNALQYAVLDALAKIMRPALRGLSVRVKQRVSDGLGRNESMRGDTAEQISLAMHSQSLRQFCTVQAIGSATGRERVCQYV